MKLRSVSLARQGAWTIGAYGASVSLKLASNIVLSRLLSPEIFGIMVIVNSIRLGIELFTDVGVEQNIVQNKNGREPDFLRTAWTLQVIRGAGLSALFLALSPLFSSFYHVDLRVFLIIALAPFINSMASISIFVQIKDQDVRGRNLFEVVAEVLAFAITVCLALITPTVWALVSGAVLSVVVRSAISYVIKPRAPGVGLNWGHVREIIGFGKWILITSFVVYAASNIDRIYFGKIISLHLLGLYGLARTISDLPKTLANRLSYQIVFPFLADLKTRGAKETGVEFGSARQYLVLAAAVLMASFTAWSDWAVYIMYDPRYHEAGWMLFTLMIGAWFSGLASLNEAALLGFGLPAYSSFANAIRLAVLAIGLPICFSAYGLVGAIVMVSGSELFRYALIAAGQMRCGVTFAWQDLSSTAVFCVTIAFWALVRQGLSLGMPWSG